MKYLLFSLLALFTLLPSAFAGGPTADTAFVANGGQWPDSVQFRARIAGARVWVLEDGFIVDRSEPSTGERGAFRVRFRGENEGRAARGEGHVSSHQNFFLGDSFSVGGSPGTRSVPACSMYESVLLPGLAPGIDVRLRLEGSHLEYDLLVEAGAQPQAIRVELEGSKIEGLSEDGTLLLRDPFGQLCSHSAPRSFTLETGEWTPTPSELHILSETSFTFLATERCEQSDLVVDPGLEWSTYLGTADDDRGIAVVVAPNEDVIVVGDTASFDFPTTMGVLQPALSGSGDVFVSRLAADGSTLRWSTFLGGTSTDNVNDVHLDSNGDVVVSGSTFSSDFPTTPGAYQTSLLGVSSGFVSRINAQNGQALLASTFVGGSGFDVLLKSAITPSASAAFPDSIVVVGSTNGGFPVTSQVWQANFAGGPSFGGDGFVARLHSDLGGAHFSTYLGASGGSESCRDVAIRANGDIVVCGTTNAPNFPATSGAQIVLGGGSDGFLFELSSDGRQRIASTYFGGSGEDTLVRIALTSGGALVAAGDTRSSDLPTASGVQVFQSALAGERDVCLARWSSDLSNLTWSSYLGGLHDDEALDLVLATNDEPIVVGATKSRQFPSTTWSFDPYFSGPFPITGFEGDAFATRFKEDGSSLEYGTFLGSTLDEQANGIALAGDGSMVLTGQTTSFQFPITPGAFDVVADGSGLNDAWTLRLDFSRFPFVVGNPKLTSIGNQPLIYPSGFPSVSQGNFSVSVDGAEPNTGFTLLLSSNNLVERPFFGGMRYVGHPIQRVGTSPLGFFGSASIDVPGDASMIGQTWRYQFWFQDPNDAFGVGLSDAVEVTYVP